MKPHLIVLGYWLVIIPLAAFFLRQACSLCRAPMPGWRRAIISVLLITVVSYLTFDFTCYLIMRSLDGGVLVVPPGYGYHIWFREAPGLKWAIVSQAGPLRFLPYVFALCAVGFFQVLALEGEVPFRLALVIVCLQTAATTLCAYVLTLLLGTTLASLQGTAPPSIPPEAAKQAAASAAERPRSKRAKGAKTVPTDAKAPEPQSKDEPLSLQLIARQVEESTRQPREQALEAVRGLKAYADEQFEELNEDLAPVISRLPEPVQGFLSRGGWWWILGACALLILLWARSLLGRLRKAFRRPRKKRPRGRKAQSLKENLDWIGGGFSEDAPNQVLVKGLPGRLRLLVLAPGSRNAGALSEEMADRVLDWIKPGLAEVAVFDQPGVRVWPPFYGSDGFAAALAANVPIPEMRGVRSHWVLVAGQVRMARSVVQVGMAIYTQESQSLRLVKVRGERWPSVLALRETPELSGAR